MSEDHVRTLWDERENIVSASLFTISWNSLALNLWIVVVYNFCL